TQKVLPFGTPAEVREQVLQRCDIFSKNEGQNDTNNTSNPVLLSGTFHVANGWFSAGTAAARSRHTV
ncbi:MAG: hypothetical protein ACI3XZ_00995, partial [Butyricicoccus sp.]